MRLLIVDDDDTVRESLADALDAPGREILTAPDGGEALRVLSDSPAELVITDIRMPGIGGIELFREIRERSPGADVILITAYEAIPPVVEAMKEGAREFLVKPLDLQELRALVDRVLAERVRAPPAVRAGRSTAGVAASPPAKGEIRPDRPPETPEEGAEYRLDRLVGRAPRMIEVFKLVGQAAATRVNILIRGESGTGKELIARAIHHESEPAAGPFVPVNCTAIPATLLESELFGHVKGAFTGAAGDRKGRFAMAGRGTIFLDEVGDTPLDFQSKLLRVLQEHEYYPVGADRPQRTDARVIAATHRDLEAAVEEERFRADLYFRLRVLEIRVPPLRERPDDLPELAQHLLERISRTLGRAPPSLSEEVLRIMSTHPWPGNVRELENCLTRAVVVAAGGVIRPEHLDLVGTASPAKTALRSLDEMEAEHVRGVLEATGWRKARTAEILGVSRPRLNRLIEKHGLP